MDTDEQRILKKKLLHIGRPKLVKQLKRCETSNASNSATYGSKNDLISRIINSIVSHKKNKEMKNKKKKKINRKPLKISDPIYNDHKNETKTKNKNKYKPKRNRKRKLSPSLPPKPMPKKKKKAKLKPKLKRKHKKDNMNPQKYIYKIINMPQRPFLNGKHCKIISSVDNNNQYRISLINNGSQHIISTCNIKKITAKHRRQKAIDIASNDNIYSHCFSNVTIKESMDLIKPFEIDKYYIDFQIIYAIGVFVDYQMILKIFINTDIQYLFGTKYKSFKTVCLSFLDENDGYRNKYKIIDDLFIMFYYKCNDKQIIFLMRNDNKCDTDRLMGNISAIKAIDLSLMYVCNAYRNMPSDFDTLQQVFKISDKYGFGEINKKEFHTFLSALTVKTNITSSSSCTLFDKVDGDKIKAITFNQFAKYMIENKKILWELLLELARDFELEIDISLVLYQNTLSKIHKLLLIMDEMCEMYECINNIRMYEDKMMEYIQFIITNQKIIDDKTIDYKKECDANKCKNIKYLEKTSDFIHNNMPDIN